MWTHRSFLVLLLHLAETTLFAPAAAESNREEAAPEVLPLIIGGTVAGLEQYPYYVYLSMGCGGSLIAPKVVLTAAHCIDGPEGTDGADDIVIEAFVGATTRTCVQWKAHKDYIDEELDEDSNLKPGTGVYGGYDFALCELDTPVNIDDSEVFLELNKDPGFPSENADDVMTEAMGMGAIEVTGTGYREPDVLMRTDLPLLDNATCKRRDIHFDEATMMCTQSGNSSTCKGDSGGPVVVVSPSSGGRTKHTQIGAVSWGEGTCDYINVDARVSSGIDWIRAVVCDEWKIEDAASLCETLSPSSSPSDSPTYSPTAQPSAPPSDSPSDSPTAQPSAPPSDSPSDSPSAQPSASPSDSPSAQPSASPSYSPSDSPSAQPSAPPSDVPSGSASPSDSPSKLPSEQPSASVLPSAQPSAPPSDSPSVLPSEQPSAPPSYSPSVLPSEQPSAPPSDSPSAQPSAPPSDSPSAQPSASPSVLPSDSPSDSPSEPPSTIKSGKNGKNGKKATKKTKKKKNTKENKKGD